MARTKTTPTKEREGRMVLCTCREWACLAREARQEGERSEEMRRRWLPRQAREEKVKEKWPPSPVHHPSPAKSSSPMREVVQVLEEMMKWVEEASRLEEVGQSLLLLPTQQLAQMAAEARSSVSGGSLPEGNSILPLEARPHRRNSRRQGRSKRPGSTSLAWLPSVRSGGTKRVLNSLFGSSPSHG